MTTAPIPESRRSSSHGLGWWIVRLSAVSGLAFVVGLGAVATAYAVGEEASIEDTTLGVVLAATAFAGFLGAAVAFVTAIALVVANDTKQLVREGAWVRWLPFCVFPALVLIVVLGEVFVWE